MNGYVLAIALLSLPSSTAEAPPPPPAEELIVPPGGAVRLEVPGGGSEPLSLEAALDGGLLRPVTGVVMAPETGDHWLTVASRDANGTLSELRWVRLRVDHQPPEVTLEVEPAPIEDAEPGGTPRRWVGPGALAKLRADDDLAGVAEIHLEGGASPARAEAAELSVPLPARGPAVLSAGAVDRVGNASPLQRVELFVDAEPPQALVRLVGPTVPGPSGIPVIGPGAGLEVLPRDEHSGIASWTPRTWSGDSATEVAPASLSGPWPKGRHRVDVLLTDRVGNQGTAAPLEFEADDEGPEMSWSLQGLRFTSEAGETFYRRPVTVEVTAADVPAGVAHLEWAEGEESPSWKRLEGASGKVESQAAAISIRGTDGVGNVRREEISWRVDDDPPRLRLEAPDGRHLEAGEDLAIRFGQTVRVWAQDDGVGLAQQETSLGQGAWVALPRILRFRTPGAYRVEARATDHLGHEASALWQVQVLPAGGNLP